MVVAGDLDDAWNVVVRVLLVSGWANPLQQIIEVLICDRELLKQTVCLKEFKSEVLEGRLLEYFAISEDVKVPLVEVVHELDEVGPDAGIHADYLP